MEFRSMGIACGGIIAAIPPIVVISAWVIEASTEENAEAIEPAICSVILVVG